MIKQWKFLSAWYSVTFISCLSVALIIGGIINMWTLVYPIILITPIMYGLALIKLWISNLLTRKVATQWSRKKTIWISIILHVIYMIGALTPVLLGLIINIHVMQVFNVYMLITYFVISLLILNVLRYAYWKKQMIQVQKGVSDGKMKCN